MRITLIVIALLLVVAPLQAQDTEIPPLGEIYTVGEHNMHLYCTGEGTPTVILEAGVAGYTLNWFELQPRLAEHTRVCSYDRLGYGWSSALPGEFDMQQAVDNLHTLLSVAQIAPPYIFVPHSFGGPVTRAYHAQYPEHTIGIVLMDTVPPEMATEIPFYEDALTAQLDSIRIFATFARIRAAQTDEPLFPPPEEIPTYVSEAFASQVLEREFVDTSLSEAMFIVNGLPQLALPESIGDIPLVVLSHGIANESAFMGAPMRPQQAAEAEATWQRLQRNMAALSPQGRLVIAENSDHSIQLDNPELVVQTVLEMMSQQ
ncbi:MAG: alpha/beta hydrolase [Chloroflexota bacterium]